MWDHLFGVYSPVLPYGVFVLYRHSLIFILFLILSNCKNKIIVMTCKNSFKELHIIIQLKTKYLQHSVLSRLRIQCFINSFNVSEGLV